MKCNEESSIELTKGQYEILSNSSQWLKEELAVMPMPEDLDDLVKQVREIIIPLAIALDVPKCNLDDAAEFVFSMVWEDFQKHKQTEEGDIEIWRN
jgi:hypothetical protein